MTARVLFLSPHPIEGPTSRFRAYQYIPNLAAQGVTCDLRPFLSSAEARALHDEGGIARKVWLTLKGLAGRLGDVVRAGRYDVVFVCARRSHLDRPSSKVR